MRMKSVRERITIGVIFVFTVVLTVLQPFYAMDHMITDMVYQRPGVTNKQIKIIKIDEKTLDAYGPTGEWSREIPGKLIQKLNENPESKPAVIALAVRYLGNKDEESDAFFAEECEKAGNVILAANIVYKTNVEHYINEETYVNTRKIESVEYPYEALEKTGVCGFANKVQDRDGYIRRTILTIPYEQGNLDSLAYATYKQYQKWAGAQVQTPELDSSNQTEFTFSGDVGDYESVSLCDVLDGTIDARIFQDSIVLFGAYAPGLLDSYNTAIDKGSQMYGVEIHANIIEALLEQRFSQPANVYLEAVISAFAAVLLYLMIRRKNLLPTIGITLAFGAAETVIGIFLRKSGITISLFYFYVAILLILIYKTFMQYILERRSRTQTLDAFKKYIAPQIVEELSHNDRLEIKLGGENRDIAVLFVDIRGFTTMSESLEPEEVVEILNQYLDLATKSVFDHNGTLDKFVGDAAMAVFNAPFDLDDYVFRAVCTARDIAGHAEELEESVYKKYGKKIGFGIGVNCGPAVVGNIGSEFRMDYTAIGDTVNTAARLESVAKKGQILVSEAVYEVVKDRVEAEEIGNMPLKGKAKEVKVYSIIKVIEN